jgi:hypothetical protein
VGKPDESVDERNEAAANEGGKPPLNVQLIPPPIFSLTSARQDCHESHPTISMHERHVYSVSMQLAV